MNHSTIEKNIGLMAILVVIAISLGGLAEIVPLMFQANVIEPVPGLKPYPPLQLAGRDVYIREGCYNCHSQMIRALASEVLRYGHYSVAGESVYDHPFQWGSKRTGPDLARIGGRYSDDWQRVHLANPRNVVPESIMPGYPWLNTASLSAEEVESHMRGLAKVGLPYTDADYASVSEAVKGKTEMDALVAYLQNLGKYGPKENLQ
jgi:cytochrome c oxidase cbb3-type subunit 2